MASIPVGGRLVRPPPLIGGRSLVSLPPDGSSVSGSSSSIGCLVSVSMDAVDSPGAEVVVLGVVVVLLVLVLVVVVVDDCVVMDALVVVVVVGSVLLPSSPSFFSSASVPVWSHSEKCRITF